MTTAMGAERASVPGTWSAHPEVPPMQGNPFIWMATLAFVNPITVILMGGVCELETPYEKTVGAPFWLLSCATTRADIASVATNTGSENVEN
jgi:hypothetical protein